MRRKISTKLTLGLAAGVAALCGAGINAPVQAQTSTTMSSTAAPTTVTGTVVRYYVDRAGYVTAVDLQTASGVEMVRFSPGMAQRLTSMYPVGSTATVYASQWNGSWYLVGAGPTMPAPTALYEPYTVTALDLLKSEPYTVLGAKQSLIEGELTGYVADEGEVLAIVLDGNKLIRVPRESRQGNPSNIPEGVTPMFKGAKIVATVMPEAPRYGALSPFESRWIASSISVDGETLGAKGFGKVGKKKKSDTLFGWNISIFGGNSPEEVKANNWGYSTYAMPGTTPGATPANQ